MPSSFRAALIRQSLKKLRTLLADRLLRLRVRWRHNPGFVAAAAAGSIGLVLALGLAIQGGIRLLSATPVPDLLEEESSTFVLEEPAGEPDLDNDLGDPFNERAVEARPVARRNPFEDEDDSDLDEMTVPKTTVAARETLDSQADADEDDADGGVSANGEESTEIATLPSEQKPERLTSDIGPIFGDDHEPEEADDVDLDNSRESDQPAATVAKTPGSGWKRPPSDSPAGVDAAAALAQQSRAVETVVYAAPQTNSTPSSTRSGQSNEEDEKPRLAIEVIRPKTVAVGQTCNVEIRVKNTGAGPAKNLILSVELPAALSHDVAQSLEQRVPQIAAGATYRALLRLRAKSPGEVSLSADVARQGRVLVQSSATVEVKQAATASAKLDLPNCSDLLRTQKN